ncbi:zinc finger protein 607-like [Melanerpes formicivorus]|uniref:zinc finger protein 607-like n=1 Tax=Melanerpes formicivorus TaxID=211600 RepID=UPI00358E1B44
MSEERGMPEEQWLPEDQGMSEPVDDSESDVFEIDLPIIVLVLSDDDLIQDDTEKQAASLPEVKQDGELEVNTNTVVFKSDETPLNDSNRLSICVENENASNKGNSMKRSEETCVAESVCNNTKTSLCDAGTDKYSQNCVLSTLFCKTEFTEVHKANDRECDGDRLQKIPLLSTALKGGDEAIKTSRQVTLAAIHKHEEELVSVANIPSDGSQEKQPEIPKEMETTVEMEDPGSSKNGDKKVRKRSKFKDESLSSLLEHGLKEESEFTYCPVPVLSGCASEELLKNVGETEINASTSAESNTTGEHIYKTLKTFPRKRHWQQKAVSPDASPTEFQSLQGLSWLSNSVTIKPLSKASSVNKHARLKCRFCTSVYKSSAHLKKHVYSAHKDKKIHKCCFCKRTFFFSVNLKNHLKFHKKISKLQKERKNRINVRKLMQRRSEERKSEIKKKESKYENFFINIERDFTPQDVPVSFSCKRCLFASSNPRIFINHMKGHKERPPYQCPQCDYSCVTLSYLLNHMYWHAGYKLYQCRFCTFFSLYFESMVRHSYIHTGAKPYSCEFCESAFTSITGLKRHRRLHASEETSQGQQVDFISGRKTVQRALKHYTCGKCNTVFYSREHLSCHKKFHDQFKATANGYVNQSNEYHKSKICRVDSSQDHSSLSPPGKDNECFTGEVLASEIDYVKAGEVWDNKKNCSEKKFHANSHRSKNLPITGNRSEGPVNSYKMDTLICREEPLFNCRDFDSQVQDDNVYQRCMENLEDTQASNFSRFKTYKCQHCNYATVDYSNFKMHLKIHTNERPFVCEECNETFKTSNHLEKHILIHVKNGYGFYHCLYVDSHLENLELHHEMHDSMCPERHFDSLEGSSNAHSLLDSGVSGVLPDVQRVKETELLVGQPRFYQCAECEYATHTLNNLELHIRTHTDEKPYSCSVCQKKFRTSSHLRRHTVTHSNIEHLKCSNCDYSTKNWLSLKQHLALHSCKESSSTVSLYQPQNQLPFKTYKCEQCGYSTARSGNLKLHLRIHTGEKPFKCGQCAVAFCTSSHLKRHLLTHLKLRCRRCKFSTLDKHAFQKHAKTHIKKYKCGKCNVMLPTKKLLEKHKQQHELEV